MIEVKEAWILPFNIFLIALIALLFFVGYKKGFVRSLLSLVVTLVSFYAAYILSDILGKHVKLWPVDLSLLHSKALEDAARYFVNRICWFVLLFIVIRLAFIFIDLFFKSIKQLPILKEVDSFLGGIIGVIESFIFIVIICFFLNTPLFSNGNILVEKSIIKPINSFMSIVFNSVTDDVDNANAITQLIDNGNQLTDQYKEQLENWLIDNGYVDAYQELDK